VTRSSDRVGAGVMYILFGVSPWLWVAMMFLASGPLEPALLRNRNTVRTGVAIVLGVGVVALVTALVVGIGAHVAHVMRRRAERARDADAPARPDVPGTATTVARVASLVGVATVWGAFAAITMSSFLPLPRVFRLENEVQPISLLLAAVTVASLVRGLTQVAQRRRPG